VTVLAFEGIQHEGYWVPSGCSKCQCKVGLKNNRLIKPVFPDKSLRTVIAAMVQPPACLELHLYQLKPGQESNLPQGAPEPPKCWPCWRQRTPHCSSPTAAWQSE
jgi:hypothetical protein